MTDATKRYLLGWTGAALAAGTLLVLVVDTRAFDLRNAVVLLAFMAVAELIVISIRVGPTVAAFTLSEAGIVAGLLLVAPVHVVVATAIATVVAHLPLRITIEKVWFNLCQVTVATSAAAITMEHGPAVGPTVGGASLVAAALAMAVYATVNTLAFRGLMLRLDGPQGRASFDRQAPLTLVSMLGTVAVGVVAAHLWMSQPLLIALLLAPLLAVQSAARSSLRAERLVTTLRTERDRLEQVVVGASDGILLLDEHAVVQIWSPALQRMSGISADRAVGSPIADLLTDQVREAADPVRGTWHVDGASGRRVRSAARWRGADGQMRDVQEDHALLFDDRDRCIGDVVLVRDVSRERALERLRGDFVARVSHELRTPLTPIRGYIHLLLQRSARMTDQQRSDALHRILDRANRLSTVIEDLLLVTQLERGDVEELVDPTPVDLADIVSGVVRDATERAAGRTITFSVDPTTPEALADPPRVRQIVGALVDNAVRYSPTDLPVEVTLDAADDMVRIAVVDHGQGIAAGDRQRVFEQFQRLEDPMTMRTTGVGLGLFIARRLALAMGGTLDLEPGQDAGRDDGSVFVLHLPSVKEVQAADGPATSGDLTVTDQDVAPS